MAKNQYLNLGHLHGIGHQDLEADDLKARMTPGQFVFTVDAFGTRIFQYGRNTSGGAVVQGALQSRLADVAVSNLTSGTTISATKAAAWTADKHVGEMLYVTDNDDSAGAAPEGEVSIISSNSAGVANVDPNYAFTVALAANDDLDTISPGWHWQAAAASDKAQEVKGVVVAKSGLTSLYYGFLQCYGICPVTNLKASTGFTDRAAIIADTSAVAPDAAGGWELVIGYTIGTVTSDIVPDQGVTFLNLFGPTLNAGTP